jgi:antitoxin (DNA-binding transcriptional repressor) of toxin-antitoxin stability system
VPKRTKTSSITVTQLRGNFPDIARRMFKDGESFKVMKRGKHFATLSPITDKKEKARLNAKLQAAIKAGTFVPANTVLKPKKAKKKK